MKPTEQQLKEFMIKNYGPEWAGNLKLAEMLWKKKNGQKVIVSNNNNKYKEIERFNDVNDIGLYEIECILFDVNFTTYLGCPKCKRKSCNHGLAPVEYAINGFILLDKAGDVKEATYLIPLKDVTEKYSPGDAVKIQFFYKNDNIYTNDIKIVKKVGDDESDENDEQINNSTNNQVDIQNNEQMEKPEKAQLNESNNKLKELLVLLDNLGRLNKLAFEKMVNDRGIDLNLVNQFVELMNGYYELSDVGSEFIKG